MKFLISFSLVFLITSLFYCQSITNTLGDGGIFSVRDTSQSYFTIDQLSGSVGITRNLFLPVSSSQSIGTIYKAGYWFIHDYAPPSGIGHNTFMGINSGNFTMTDEAESNTGFGYSTLANLWSGTFNTAIGSSSLHNNNTGSLNTSVGTNTLWNNLSGYRNTSVGTISMYSNTTGYKNTAVGVEALRFNTSGFHNTAVGHHSLQNNNGSYNTALGYNAGSTVTTGANLTLLGIDANPSTPTVLNQITLGNSFVTSLRCNVQNISSLSDARDKKNIKELNLGIDFLMKLKPRIFNWDKREWYLGNKSDGSKMSEMPSAGFIAQELDEVQLAENAEWLNLVLKDNREKIEATPGNLLPVIVKAVQDLKKENDELKRVNDKLGVTIAELTSRLSSYEKIQNKLLAEIEKNEQSVSVSMGE